MSQNRSRGTPGAGRPVRCAVRTVPETSPCNGKGAEVASRPRVADYLPQLPQFPAPPFCERYVAPPAEQAFFVAQRVAMAHQNQLKFHQGTLSSRFRAGSSTVISVCARRTSPFHWAFTWSTSR